MVKLEKLKIDKSSKFKINYPYIALLSDSDIQKLQFGYSSYNLTIGPIIASFYTGAKFTYNIVSFVDKVLSCKLIFNEEKIDEDLKNIISCFSIKEKVPPTEPISFTVPLLSKNQTHILKGHLEIRIEESEIEPLCIEFTFNIILLPLEIYFLNENAKLFWDENRLCLKDDSYKEGEKLDFHYIIRNFDEDITFLNKNYSLKSLGKNEVDNKPLIIKSSDKANFLVCKCLILKKGKNS